MRSFCAALLLFHVALAGCDPTDPPPPPPPPPPSSCDEPTPPPVPERVTLADCSSIVDVASFPPLPAPPACPPPAEPVASLCPGGGAAPGGLIETQEQLEAYRGCTSIVDEALTIVGACSLAPLADVETIEGRLNIGVGPEGNADALTIVDLDGLQSLRSVGQTFAINGAPSLASLDGLDALEEVGFDFEIDNVPSLVHLRGPPSLRAVGGQVQMEFDDALVYVDGFDALEELGSPAFRPEKAVRFVFTPSLLCVDGFASLTDLDVLEMSSAPELLAVPGLANAIVAGAPELSVNDSPAFDFLTLPPLEELAGISLIRPAPSLTDLRAFAGLQRLGLLRIVESDIESLGGLDDLVALERFEIDRAAALDDISALSNVVELGAVTIQGAPTYDLRCAFAGASTVEVLAYANTTFSVLTFPQSFQRIESLQVGGNQLLSDLGDTDATLGDVIIAGNAPLTNDDVIAWLAERDIDGVAKFGANSGEKVDPCPWQDDGVCDSFLCESDSEADCPPVEK